MAEQPINLSGGLPSTDLPEPDAETQHALVQALASDDPRAGIAQIVAAQPRLLVGWAELGDLGRDPIERYAAYRVGYHRGLDSLRAAGWRGSGYVRWASPGNHGFLRSLLGLHLMATVIGEQDEADRCAQFLLQLDPNGVPSEVVERVPPA